MFIETKHIGRIIAILLAFFLHTSFEATFADPQCKSVVRDVLMKRCGTNAARYRRGLLKEQSNIQVTMSTVEEKKRERSDKKSRTIESYEGRWPYNQIILDAIVKMAPNNHEYKLHLNEQELEELYGDISDRIPRSPSKQETFKALRNIAKMCCHHSEMCFKDSVYIPCLWS